MKKKKIIIVSNNLAKHKRSIEILLPELSKNADVKFYEITNINPMQHEKTTAFLKRMSYDVINQVKQQYPDSYILNIYTISTVGRRLILKNKDLEGLYKNCAIQNKSSTTQYSTISLYNPELQRLSMKRSNTRAKFKHLTKGDIEKYQVINPDWRNSYGMDASGYGQIFCSKYNGKYLNHGVNLFDMYHLLQGNDILGTNEDEK